MSKSKRGGRGFTTSTTTNRYSSPSARPTAVRLSPIPIQNIPLNPISDRRIFNPMRTVTLPNPNRAATRVVVDNYGKSIRAQTKAPLRFAIPHKVDLCVRRKTRKQVIHAKGIAGTRTRKPRRNFWSDIKC